MDIYEKREEFSSALKIKKKIDRLIESKAKCLLSPDELKGKPLSDVPSGSGDKTDNIEVIEIIDQKLDEYYKDLEKAKAVVEDRIDKLTLTDLEDEIMRYRYVSCMEWREVARCCGYTERHVRRMDSEIMGKI